MTENNSLNAINKALDGLYKRLKGLDQFAATINGIGNGGGGSGSGVMDSSLAKVSTVAQSRFSTIANVGSAALQAGLGAAAGISSAMPSVALTLARESGIYGAGVASGGLISRNRLESSTRLGLGKFANIEGATGVVSGILAGRGMVPGSKTYNQTVTSVSQAARYLNMPNDVAAQAIEGLTSGPTSAMMMNSFGVFTSNPINGQAMTQGQIFEQLANRWTGGGKTSVEGTMESIRRGNLGSNIRNSGLDPAQQALLSQYMIDRANGINMDLSNPNAITDAVSRNKKQGFENPFLSGMELTSKNDQMMERATKPYIEGVKAATGELIKLKDSIMGLPDSFYQTKAAVDTFLGDFTGAGVTAAVVAGVTGLFGIIGSVISGAIGVKAAKAILGGKGTSPTSSSSGTTKPQRSAEAQAASKYSAKPKTGNWFEGFMGDSGKTLGKIGGVIGKAFEVGFFLDFMDQGGQAFSWPEKYKNAKNGAELTDPNGRTFKKGSSMDPSSKTYVGNMGGAPSTVGTGTYTVGAASSSGRPNLKAPVKAPITCRFGVRDKMHPNGHHGTDYGVGEGTSVGASGDGIVKVSSYSTALGNIVEIDHGSGYSTLYAHLSQSLVTPGTRVSQGEIIAKSGNTGTATTGPHLHFEIRLRGASINPSPFIGGGGAVDLIAGAFESVSSLLGDGSVSNAISGAVTGLGDLFGLNGGGQAAPIPSSYSGAGYVNKGKSTGSIGMGRANSGAKGTGTGSGGGSPAYSPVMSTAVAASSGTGGGTSVTTETRGGNTVTINLSIQKATTDEAKKFAALIKEYLEEDNLLHKMGSK